MPASFPQYVTNAITGKIPDPPGVKLQKQGFKAKHHVVFVPGIVTGGLEMWEGHPCMDGLFRKRLWGGTFGELYKSGHYVLHFMKLAKAPAPIGGGGGSDRCAKHIKVVMNIGGPLLRLPKIVAGLFSAEAKDIAIDRTVAPGVDIFGFQTLQHAMQMARTWDSTMSLIPKGGDTICDTLDWAPEAGHDCAAIKIDKNDTQATSQNGKVDFDGLKSANYGRIISFGKDVVELHSSKIHRVDLGWGVKAVVDYKIFSVNLVLDLLEYVAPRMMKHGSAHYSYGIVENLDDENTSIIILVESLRKQWGYKISSGATEKDLGGDRVYSTILKWSEKINLQ
ncbi:hypothetical protein OSB04_015240 [Centaurea solstitialis]|uniref:Uncharacterized protein n=1 Tax=Centaurea solstitialis TaxID=347529 RepID=A0AA38WGC7_9ASTR|nr:hypothetical protein OSB04_015240 [Centaurea solstitialis]